MGTGVHGIGSNRLGEEELGQLRDVLGEVES